MLNLGGLLFRRSDAWEGVEALSHQALRRQMMDRWMAWIPDAPPGRLYEGGEGTLVEALSHQALRRQMMDRWMAWIPDAPPGRPYGGGDGALVVATPGRASKRSKARMEMDCLEFLRF